jgi:membrane protein implicated in regulation of membrane protease activity
MTWWYWLVLGLVLIALEMASAGGFYIIFFGVAALIVGPLAYLGIAEPVWLQWLLFSALSVASLVFFRNPLMRKLNLGAGSADLDTLAGETGTALDDIGAGGNGHVELRGTTWSARNTGSTPLARGHRCIVVRADKLTLLVKAEEAVS